MLRAPPSADGLGLGLAPGSALGDGDGEDDGTGTTPSLTLMMSDVFITWTNVWPAVSVT